MPRKYAFTRADQAETKTAHCSEHGDGPHYVSSRRCVACTRIATAARKRARGPEIEALRNERDEWRARALRAEETIAAAIAAKPTSSTPDLLGDM